MAGAECHDHADQQLHSNLNSGRLKGLPGVCGWVRWHETLIIQALVKDRSGLDEVENERRIDVPAVSAER